MLTFKTKKRLKFDLIKIKELKLSNLWRGTLNRMERQITNWKKISETYTTNKGLVSRTYKGGQ